MTFFRLFLMLLLMPILLEGSSKWSQSAEGGFSASAEFSNEELSVEDLLKVKLLLTYPDTYHVDVEQLQENLLRHSPLYAAPFRVLEPVSNHQVSSSDHSIEQTLIFTLQPELPGTFSLTFYDIQFIPDVLQEKPVEIISDIVEVKIDQPSAEGVQFIKPRPLLTLSPALPIQISEANQRNILESKERQQAAERYNHEIMQQSSIPWLEILLVFLVSALLIAMRYAPTLAKKPEETPYERITRLHKESLEKLDGLHQQKLLDQHLYIPFYVGVADTVREYVDEKYRLNIAARTTQEFVQQIEATPIVDPEIQQPLEQFFLHADRVKFSQEPPTLAECKAAEQIARKALS